MTDSSAWIKLDRAAENYAIGEWTMVPIRCPVHCRSARWLIGQWVRVDGTLFHVLGVEEHATGEQSVGALLGLRVG